jgi:hypothetical protein
LDNTVKNEPVFNYVSADGKETFQLKISPVSPKMMAAKSIINSDSDASPLPLIKEVEVEGQSITLTITGNITNGELSNLINTIKIKKNTTQPLNSSPTN